LYDLSNEGEPHGIRFVIFRPEADMPQVSVGDIVVLTSVRVHKYLSDPLSLITNRNTSIRVYTASKIPQPPQSAQPALLPSIKRDSHRPTAQENAYVSHLYHKFDKYSLPDEHEFQQRAAQSLNVKQKFSLLKDVQEGRFYDLVVQVAREPYTTYDMTTLYVSDYTENPNFHLQMWPGLSESAPGGGDPYGYTSGNVEPPKTDWIGPYGKMSLQVTCYEPHSTYVREEVTAGQWIALRNVQVKYGSDGSFLEGFLRGERNASNARINVTVLETADRETIDPRLKEAIRRCRDYGKKKKQQIQEVKAAQVAGLKRKASAPSEQEERAPKSNSKGRRKAKRAAKQQQQKEKHTNGQLRLELNDQVTCEAHDTPYSTIESILEPPLYETTINNQTAALAMPFTCAKHKTQARVVDFFPPSLEDFACGRKHTEFDMLSDNEDDDDSASSSSDDEGTRNASHVWEWRFALQLEDSAPPGTDTKEAGSRSRLWVFVDNLEAQCLTGLDATDLRQDPATLAQLRERMFTLWGDLEEHKERAAGQKQQKTKLAETGNMRDPRREKPPMESDAEEEGEESGVVVSNKPFACCIKQYGVYEKERGDEGRWVKCFGLFGTKICS
jgi:hypothetical protein